MHRLTLGLGLAIVALVGLVGLWSASALAERARAELVEAKRSSASMVVRVFAASLAAPLDFGDDEGIRTKMANLRSNAEVLYAGVWRAGEDDALTRFGREPPSTATAILASQVLPDALEIVERVTDPTARHLGTVKVGFTLVPELRRYESTRNRILLFAGLLTMIFSALVLWFARRTFGRRSDGLAGDGAARARIGLPQQFYPLSDGAASGPGPGDVLGRYQLLTCVGQGGMGRVWAARQLGSPLERLVAIKTATERAEEGPDHRTLFMDEARIALLIRHPNVCGVYELGEHDGRLYQVMEWCDGASLRQVLDRLPNARMDLRVAARITAKVGAGLHAAHELEDDDGVQMHVVHRDVSPQNILISTQGQVKMTDFGVAKATGQLHKPTSTGEVKGKLSYMAPEQVIGQEVDRRADIFALGCVMYEASTGRSPFASEGALSTLYQLISQPVASPTAWVSDYPQELADIVLKALSKDPADRYETAEQFAVALECWLALSSEVVTEQSIAELVTGATGSFVREKLRLIEQATRLIPQPDGFGPEVLTLPLPMLNARPTVPAGPAGRKPGTAQ